MQATKFMSDLSPARTQARLVQRQMKNHVEPLGPFVNPLASILNMPISLPSPTALKQEIRLFHAWKAYLRWEEGNPLELEQNDPMLFARIQAAYRKALVRMRFHSEIWFLAANWYISVNKSDEAHKLLEEGLRVHPKRSVLPVFGNQRLLSN
jgi:cleavage stimulation factor subunit 3